MKKIQYPKLTKQIWIHKLKMDSSKIQFYVAVHQGRKQKPATQSKHHGQPCEYPGQESKNDTS